MWLPVQCVLSTCAFPEIQYLLFPFASLVTKVVVAPVVASPSGRSLPGRSLPGRGVRPARVVEPFAEAPPPGIDLNPFFIRSAVGICLPQRIRLERFVSIPSSSGLRLELIKNGRCINQMVSQSLLHQVCGWNRRSGRGGIVVDRLNPFFIRSAVGTLVQRLIDHNTDVSIPSSSGLRLELSTDMLISSQRRLNPFFIRSAVGTSSSKNFGSEGRSQSLLHQVCGWNRDEGDLRIGR